MAVQLLDRRTSSSAHQMRSSAFSVLRRVDFVLLFSVAALTVFGFVMVYSASRSYAETLGVTPSYFLKHQLLYAFLGIALFLFTALVDYRNVEEWAYPIYGVIICALLAVFVLGHSQNGAVRWIPLGPVSFQPSEFGVLGLILIGALYISRHEGDLGIRRLATILAIAALPMLLVLKQPDLGTTMVMGIVLLWLLYLGGVRLRFLFAMLALVVLAFVAGSELHIIHGYQLTRLSDYLHQSDPSNQSYWNLHNSELAIGAGGFHGTGLFQGAVTNGNFVPVTYADFIFSAIGEQLGFVGASFILGLFALVAFRIYRAMQLARDTLGRLICAGVLAFIVFSVFENIGMTIGVTPITGIPLPFISYGGSALFAFFVAIGLVVNVGLHRARSH